jgi:hypothetical protein
MVSLFFRVLRRVDLLAQMAVLLSLVIGPAQTLMADDGPSTAPIFDFDASKLAPAVVTTWANGAATDQSLSPIDKPPRVMSVDGRQAVSFDGGGPLHSADAVSEDLVKGGPFTLAAAVYLPDAPKRQVIASWASRPNGTAEFSYGRGNDGAFFGWDRTLRYHKFPSPAAWHHLAWSYDQHELCLYVDGDLDTRLPVTVHIKPGGRLVLGAGWDGVAKKPIFEFQGAISRLQIWPRALSQREIRRSNGMTGPFAASPANGAVVPAEALKLQWEAGSDQAKAFTVQIGDGPDSVAKATPQRVATAQWEPKDLLPAQSLFWKVNEIDGSGKVVAAGEVWHFSTDSGPAAGPMPRDRVAGVSHDLKQFTWTPGRYANSQKFCWGTDADAVRSGQAPSVSLDAGTGAYMLPAPVDYGTTYYWRVEELNGTLPASAGQVWAFRTEDRLEPDDVTFFVSSDTHYGFGNNAEINRKVIDEMNWLPGAQMPEKAGGGIVRTPRGVILNGDLLDKGFDQKTAPGLWKEFVQDYGLTGMDGRLGYPLYEGFGNHDGMTGKSISRAAIKERNPHRVGILAISPEGFHYSWDWDNVHLVQLNLFPGTDSADCITGPPDHHPEHALQFLQADLAKNVGLNAGLLPSARKGVPRRVSQHGMIRRPFALLPASTLPVV